MKSFKISLLTLAFLLPSLLWGKTYFVSPTGTSAGNGTQAKPWDLQTALSQPSVVVAGDTIAMLDGIYKGHYTSSLKGSAAKPLTVTAYKQVKAVIDGNMSVDNETALTINGSYTNYCNFHVTNSDTKRNALNSTIYISNGIDVFGNNVKLIDLMVYDNIGNGIGFWSTAIDSEIYGCIIFHNGYQASDRGHGHGIYTQNATGTKQIRDNFIFNGFQYGVHAYTETGSISGYNIEGNICYNNGLLQKSGEHKSNVLVGGLQPADRITIKDNHLLHPFSKAAKALELGYSATNETGTVTGNILYGGTVTGKINKWKKMTFTGNTIISYDCLMDLIVDGVDYKSYTWNNNKYFGNSATTFCTLSFDEWKSITGYDSNSSFQKTLPTQNQVFVRPNQYQSGRANIVVYNWQKLSTVQVDLSSVIAKNSTFSIYDVQNIKGQPILTGTYTGQAISLPMNLTALTLPNGDVPNKPSHTGVEFGVFLVVSQSTQMSVPTNVEDASPESVYIYPNPASSVVNIQYVSSDTSAPIQVSVWAMTGKLVKSETYAAGSDRTPLQLDLSDMQNGVYLVRVGGTTQKVIVRH
jgi:hypothetical protein